MISFTIPGKPAAKGRARAYLLKGKIAHYTPEGTASLENLVKLAAFREMKGQPPLLCPIFLEVKAFFPWPAKKIREMPTTRPDLDNLIKAVLDGLNGVAWIDDKQVVAIRAVKRYSDLSRTEVFVAEDFSLSENKK